MPDDLARRHLPLAQTMAWRATRRYRLHFDTVLSDALWGLAKAIHLCTPGRPLEPYARAMIAGEILHGMRDRIGQRPAYERGDTLLEFIPINGDPRRPDAPTPDEVHAAQLSTPDHADAVIQSIDLWAAVAQLPDKEQQMITLHYQSDLSQKQIAALLDCSQMTVSRGLARASRRLRHAMESR